MATRTGKDFSNVNPKLVDEETQVTLGEGNLETDLYIDQRDLQEEFLKQPEIFAWWATLAEIAKDLVSKQKFYVERMAATIDADTRSNPPTDEKGGPIRITEKMIEQIVTLNENYRREMNRYLEYKKQLGLLQAGTEAMVQRKDMLISLGANYRAEASSNPTILKDAARERSRKAFEMHEVQKQFNQEIPKTQVEEPASKVKSGPPPRRKP
jgi:hypothetical protein